MATFAKQDFDSERYDSFRPSYPVEFLTSVLKYAEKHAESKAEDPLRIIDIGTGPGTTIKTLIKLLPATRPVHITLTDISEAMLTQARASLLKNLPQHITLDIIQCSGEELPEHVSAGVDLIMAAECIHWIDYDKLLANSQQLLKAGGCLCYWAYVDPVFIGNGDKDSTMNKFYQHFVYESPDGLGSYWEPVGRARLARMYRDSNDLLLTREGKEWKDIQVGYLVSNKFEAQGNAKENLFVIEKTAEVGMFIKYVDTWSSSHNWKAQHEQTAGSLFLKGLEDLCGLKTDDIITWQMKTTYTFASKKVSD